MSPPSINFNISVSDEFCKNVSVFSDRNIRIILEDKWFVIDGFEDYDQIKNVRAYNLEASEAGVITDYPESLEVNGKNSLIFCIKSDTEGEYHGVLLFEALGGDLVIGSWINGVFYSEDLGQGNIESKTGTLTGRVVGESYQNDSPLIVLLLVNNVLLMFLLAMLLIVTK